MGKVEIKIRKKILTPDNLQQYRNYPALLKQHARHKRFKRALRIFLYSLALTAFVLSLIFISVWKIMLDENRHPAGIQSGQLKYVKIKGSITDTLALELLSNEATDSLYIVTYKGINGRPDDVFKFPKDAYSNGKTTYRYIEEKKISVNKHDYIIKKYLYDVAHPANRVYYFYCPEFAILIFASSWHENYYLHDIGNSKNNETINGIIEAIKADPEFNYW
ncbi:MAG TPA: hypothetical protein PK325_13980 [Cyclobacteriaceae bacterium]|nr:hypothetical protein [Cyclobacteriaceae bacterium]HMV09179.1 hypothetical protein [Cyclobacteriaceae bacterium]HMV90337.1 hypothetical protein [Cyclobacteriaceae bacterium]HMX01452.1 hypothetical protein [Cyclobacteriaceae bacterium]HMX50278.1 hypothetical protein [Cyclobacteriaceae bacterium]